MPRGYTDRISRTLTPARREWLQRLADGPMHRGDYQGSAPAHCIALGWTRRAGDRHELTDSGRKVLGA